MADTVAAWVAQYAAMLAEKMQKHGATAWLVNTGWTAGGYGVGYRMKLRHTRSIVDAIHSGELKGAETRPTDIFRLMVHPSASQLP